MFSGFNSNCTADAHSKRVNTVTLEGTPVSDTTEDKAPQALQIADGSEQLCCRDACRDPQHPCGIDPVSP
jgi:hypothetical protein